MAVFGADPEHPGRHPFRSPGEVTVEGDWSNGAFWLTAKSLGSELNIHGLHANSAQGDRVVTSLLSMLQAKKATISVSDIPDLVPILSVYAACNHGAIFTDIQRLRLKESDRVTSTIAMLEALGGKAEADESTLTVFGSGLLGGTVDAVNDHRIAMAAAIAATVCSQPVTVLGAECVEKSYPRFWEDYQSLGGHYELHLR
jgi:3-phosphoshikimate 1-carboxyvinyltransferase